MKTIQDYYFPCDPQLKKVDFFPTLLTSFFDWAPLLESFLLFFSTQPGRDIVGVDCHQTFSRINGKREGADIRCLNRLKPLQKMCFLNEFLFSLLSLPRK